MNGASVLISTESLPDVNSPPQNREAKSDTAAALPEPGLTIRSAATPSVWNAVIVLTPRHSTLRDGDRTVYQSWSSTAARLCRCAVPQSVSSSLTALCAATYPSRGQILLIYSCWRLHHFERVVSCSGVSAASGRASVHERPGGAFAATRYSEYLRPGGSA